MVGSFQYVAQLTRTAHAACSKITLIGAGIFIAGLSVFSAQATVYKWTDNQGVVHFSDQPAPGAEVIPLPDNNGVSSQSGATQAQPLNVNKVVVKPQERTVKVPYASVQIMQPTDQETIRNNTGYVSIVVKLTPDLQKGDKLQVLYDGSPFGEPQNKTIIALNNVFRGEHTVAVQVIDSQGNVLATSESVTFFMHRPRVNMRR